MNIILNGAMGKMGKSISNLCEKKYKDINLIKVDLLKSEDCHSFKEIEEVRADAVIDFSSSEGTKEALDFAYNKKMPIVIGTTGLGEEILSLMKKYSKEISVFYSPNMSLGVNICFYLVDMISKKIKKDIHIHETHHTAKKDTPSGTAVMFKKIIEENGGKVSVTSSRVGDITGEHDITFALNGEKIVISHTAYSREIFAEGAIEAAKWVLKKKSGFYNFKDMLNF